VDTLTPDQPVQTPRQAYADWPQKADQRPQPWDLDKVGISPADRVLAQGAPDTISPVVIRHSFPILTSGSASPAVGELAQRLQVLGYATDLSRGENPFGIVTQDIMSAVSQFREDHGVQEDPTPYGGNTEQSRARAANTIGPFTWEALIRASDRILVA
jgi:peptidoglycan hydrolase-like protein with peptidoglycan-binding domain